MEDKKAVPKIYDDMSGEPGESKTSFGDIHRSEGTPGENQEVQIAYDETTDDGSSLGSSPYQSDEEIIKSLFAHGNDSTSSSDDQETLHADFPSMAIDIEESRLILDQTTLKRATDPGDRIFPQAAKKYLELPVTRSKVITEEISNQPVERKSIFYQRDLKRATDPGHTNKKYLKLSLQNPGDKVDVISREIQNVLRQHVGWAYVAHEMAHTAKFQCRKLPHMSICDVAIIRATQPLHILTFVEDGGKQEHAVEYNAQLTKSIMGFIKKKTGVSLDVVYGVVPASTWKDEKVFKEKLERLETVARRKALPGYLHMDTERYTAITKALVDLYSEPGVKDQLESEIIIESLERDGKALLLEKFLNQSETDSGFGRDNKQERETETQDAGDSVAEDEQYRWGPAGDLIWTREEYQRLQKDFLEPRYNSAGKLLKLKILLFGPTGMGKSSLGNGFRTALLNMEHPSNYHAVTSGQESLTTGFQGALYKNHWIYDMPGIFESRSILSSHIISILSGEVPLQAKIGKNLGIRHQTFNTPHDHHVSCVVVVLRHEHGDFGMEIQRQLECVRTTVANGDTAIHLVLTHLDECDHQFRDRANLPNLYQSSKVQEAVRMMSKKTGVLPSSISFVRNYVNETDADVISKLQHLRVLQSILSSCVDQEEKKLNQEQQERMYSVISKHDQNRRTLGPPTYGSVKAMLAVLLVALMVAVMIKLCNLPPPA
ncbi:uncharacterized protein LOC124121113 isoform X2 [Haliotis rufescens]|uniref:uncharacterized protein LOC124121113 isoform X2 n=1 Tax=Haliotis rufescens TaxID=6454 RepID=UPI00201EE2A1|nr:uncharacterized protein LOC124121113 isoform X2 [Haliotis rufescens]